MSKQVISSPHAPQAIGPYSQAIRSGGHVFLSGQIPLDPKTGALVSGGIEEQARRVLENLKAVLHAANLDFSDVVRTTIYLTDLSSFKTVNGIYGDYFVPPFPARVTIGVAALPMGSLVEIDAIAQVRS